MQARRKHARGFTLLEVLVAFAILSLSLAGVFQVFSGSLRAVRVGEEYAHATALARMRLAELGVAEWPTVGTLDGEDEEGYRWRVDVEEMRDAPVTPGPTGLVPVAVVVSVEWGRGDGRSVRLSTIRAALR